jgi:hypothetical protein
MVTFDYRCSQSIVDKEIMAERTSAYYELP